MTKATGAEIWRFFEQGFPEYHYFDDYSIDPYDENGDCALDSNTQYDLRDFGWCYLEYNNGQFKDDYNGNSTEHFFKKWKKSQNNVILSVTIPKVIEVELKDFIKARGGSVK